MRSLCVALASLAALALVGVADAAKVEVKGPHICCKQCVRVVGSILEKVNGVSDVVADAKTKTVTFTATDEAAAQAGVKALIDGGFFGKATQDGKDLASGAAPLPKGAKADRVTFTDVHVCCGQCQNAINKLFKDAKVTYDGPGPQKSVQVSGRDLEPAAVLDALRKAGFNGSAK
jgi:copper chaperone CopZ